MLEFPSLDFADRAYLPATYSANFRLHLSLINLSLPILWFPKVAISDFCLIPFLPITLALADFGGDWSLEITYA